MKSKYIFFVILLVLSSLVVAELTLPDPEQSVFTGEDFNPLNVDSYASVDFYTTVSPSEWNWAYVDWQYVDFSRTDIYANKGLYENLPDSKFKELDYNLVNYKLVPDHDLIDADKYFEDKRFLGNSLYVDSGLERGIIFTQTGFSHPETKTSATLSNYPDYSKYTVTDKGIEVDISIPVGTDKVRTIDTRKTGDALFIKTVDTKGNLIVNGIQMFEGRLGIDSDGRVFVDENSPFLITKKGININTKIKTFVYNDDKPHDDDNYVAIGETDIVARSTVPREGDFVDIDVNLESLGIILPSGVVALIANGEMQYKTREDEGLIPRLLMEFDEVYGFASVSMSSEEYSQKILYNNFRKTIGVDGPIPVSPPESFVLHFSGSSGDDIISDYKVLFVKDQGWAVVPQSVDSSKTECLTCVYDMNFEVSQIFATQKVVDRIQRKYGIPVTSADLSIQSVIDLERKLEDLPVKLRESITSINLRKWDGIQIECGSSSGLVIGCANVMGDIWVNPSYLDG
ncbi:hypothetical protein HOH30_00395, partial [Candidatus Woesearchaeota archaeon]|nr:hypothetical protein [Candidatus Woesearchaeota archaeon]